MGHSGIKSAARINSAVLAPAKKDAISNIPPFIADDALLRRPSRRGRIVSPIRTLPQGHLVRACPEKVSSGHRKASENRRSE